MELLPDDWRNAFFFGGSPRQIDLHAPNPMGAFNLGNVNPPPLPSQPAAPVASAAQNPAGGFADAFNGQPIGGTDLSGFAQPDSAGALGLTSPQDMTMGGPQGIQQSTGTLSGARSLASAVGAIPGAGLALQPAQIGMAIGQAGLQSEAGNRTAAARAALNAMPADIAPQDALTQFIETLDVSPNSTVAPGNAFDSPTGTPGTSGVNSAGQSVGFGAPGTAGAGVAGGFSSAFGGSGAGGAVGGTNFGGSQPSRGGDSPDGNAPGTGAPDAGPPGSGEGPGGTDGGGAAAGSGPGTSAGTGGGGEGGDMKQGGAVKRPFGQRPDSKMLAAKLKAGGGTVSQGSKKPGADDVPVRLSKGEFVLPTGAVDLYGPLLEKMRQAGLHNSPGGFRVFH